MAKYYNKWVHLVSYKPGDHVLRKNEASKVACQGKLAPNWEGPYIVRHVNDNGSYLLTMQDEDNIPLAWHNPISNDATSKKCRMELYIENKENGRMILNSVLNGPLVWPTIDEENATNIILQGLPPDVYAIINHHKVAKELWDRVRLLMQGTKLSLQEKECKLYDEFDKFSFVKGETEY
ncbi:hypothetical protein Tco_0143641 [Tanacetum coccineum]